MTQMLLRAADAEEQKKLHHLGEDPAVATLTLAGGEILKVACRSEQGPALLGRLVPIHREGLNRGVAAGASGNSSCHRRAILLRGL